ncbi:MAG: lamin tail domain-containing protein [Candidatus Eisenbacteria bacterium]|uniref:Lamin tail domain-containing protein n=1 Tax=Eiseniibacteriota bacterium TaxID=2212470 RepID=A0A538U433_UNCEI|nr:MAG: lamin tail domain-containing protein [Candidatus Eisenbacteria bacterium]
MRIASVLVGLLLVLLGLAPTAPAHAQSPLRLNEFMAGPARDWDGSGTFSSRDDEWVEVVNAGATSLALDGFIITDGDSLPRFALSGSLAPGDHRMVTGKESYDWEKATGHPAFGLSLANSGDAVMLWQVVGAETLRVDAYTYTSHEAAADRAMGRSPDATGAWVIFDALDPYTGTTPPQGNGCAPTPGAANACGSTPVRSVPWGRLRTIYR